jgi:hypothetical protein
MPFKYLRDPLFLFCLGLYFANRWILKPLFPIAFFHNSLNDLICIPFWVPVMIWATRRLGMRVDDSPPQWYEIVFPLVIWSVTFEIIVPAMKPFERLAHADTADIFFYVCGASIAALF